MSKSWIGRGYAAQAQLRKKNRSRYQSPQEIENRRVMAILRKMHQTHKPKK